MATPERIAVTGAGGFIGRALVARLREAGYGVVALSRAAGTDYADAAGLARALAGTQAIVHLAAVAHQRGRHVDFSANERITAALCAAARAAGVERFLFLSSIGVHGTATHGNAFSEAQAPAPGEPYAVGKLRCEELVAAAPLAYTILRPPLVYGPHAPGNFARLLALVRRGWPLPLRGVANARSFLALDNLLDLVELCLADPAAAGQVFVAADAQTVSTQEVVQALAAGLGRRAWLVPAPRVLVRAAAAAGARRLVDSLYGDLVVDAAKAQRMLGWTPRVPTLQGLAQAARESAP